MIIELTPENERRLALAMQIGSYRSADEVIDRALAILVSEDAWLSDHRHEISDKIERGFAQFERGEFFTDEESRANLEKRKAEWLAKRRP
jgi:predicted transcriptional regulator